MASSLGFKTQHNKNLASIQLTCWESLTSHTWLLTWLPLLLLTALILWHTFLWTPTPGFLRVPLGGSSRPCNLFCHSTDITSCHYGSECSMWWSSINMASLMPQLFACDHVFYQFSALATPTSYALSLRGRQLPLTFLGHDAFWTRLSKALGLSMRSSHVIPLLHPLGTPCSCCWAQARRQRHNSWVLRRSKKQPSSYCGLSCSQNPLLPFSALKLQPHITLLKPLTKHGSSLQTSSSPPS